MGSGHSLNMKRFLFLPKRKENIHLLAEKAFLGQLKKTTSAIALSVSNTRHLEALKHALSAIETTHLMDFEPASPPTS